MARIRTIKPEFFTSLDMAAHTVLARLTYIGLWTHCDDFGRCVDEPRLIHAALFALDPDVTIDDVRAVLDALHDAGQVVRYEVDGRRYLEVAKWASHQSVNRPSKQKLPGSDHPHARLTECSVSTPGGLTSGTGNREQVLQRAPKPKLARQPAPDKRARDGLWEALTVNIGQATTRTEQSNRGRTVSELLAADATPDDVTARCREYKRRYPTMALTDAALRKHWSDLAAVTRPTLSVLDGNGVRITGANAV